LTEEKKENLRVSWEEELEREAGKPCMEKTNLNGEEGGGNSKETLDATAKGREKCKRSQMGGGIQKKQKGRGLLT